MNTSLGFKLAGAVAAAILVAGSASAIQITTGGLIKPYYLSISGNDSYAGSFTLAGYDPLLQQVDSAIASFAFSDGYSADSAWEKVDISVGGLILIDDQEVNGTHQNSPYSYAWYSASLTNPMLVDLGQDGSVSYLVQLLNLPYNSDNTWLKGAKLTVQVSDRPPNDTPRIPDGGATVGMLGLAMLGLAWLRRRKG